MNITSNSFSQGDMISPTYTCDGRDMSPHLKWAGFPQGTKSFALICDDPDAPAGDWVHWILFNIPASVTELHENFKLSANTIKEIKGGTNDFRRLDYGGPCPPGGVHRYFFKIFALDKTLNLKEGIRKFELLKAMKASILDKAELMGKYSRKR